MARLANPPLIYDPRSGTYRDPKTGRFVRDAEVLRVLEEDARKLELRLQGLTRRLQAGRISLEDWQLEFADQLRMGHLRSAMLAAGGRDRLTPDHLAGVESLLKEEFEYLAEFARAIADSHYDGRTIHRFTLLDRSALYAGALKLSFWQSWLATSSQDGFKWGWRSLEPVSRHCRHCPGYASKRWGDLQEIIPPGFKCDCRNACNCKVKRKR